MKKWEKPVVQELELKNTAVEATYKCKQCGAKYVGNWDGAESVDTKKTYYVKDGACGANPNLQGNVTENNMCKGQLVPIEVSNS